MAPIMCLSVRGVVLCFMAFAWDFAGVPTGMCCASTEDSKAEAFYPTPPRSPFGDGHF